MAPDDHGPIRVSTVVLWNDFGALLTVRKRGTHCFMLPGGKPESGESAQAAAVRECAEELLINLELDDLQEIGTFRGIAANEEGREVESTVFEHRPMIIDRPAAEIEELRWLDLDTTLPDDLAPLLSNQVVPALRRRLDQ